MLRRSSQRDREIPLVGLRQGCGESNRGETEGFLAASAARQSRTTGPGTEMLSAPRNARLFQGHAR